MKAWTDYAFTLLGDYDRKNAPIREVTILSWDQRKFCRILVEGIIYNLKITRLYLQPGRAGEVPTVNKKLLACLDD